jgi:hypothetical protein
MGTHQKTITPGEQGDESKDGRPEPHRNPGEQDHEDREQGQAQKEFLRTGQHTRHDVGGRQGGRGHQHGQKQPAPESRTAPIAQRGIGHHRLWHALHGLSWFGVEGVPISDEGNP